MASREWSMGPNEPYWRTNNSFSPTLSRTWDHRHHSEETPFSSRIGVHLYSSSISSNSKESRSWMGGDQFSNHQYSSSDGVESDFSSPSESFQTQQWTPPPMQRVNIDDYVSATMRVPPSGSLAFEPSAEGTSTVGSTSSHSDGSEYETFAKPHVSSHRNFSTRCSFMSKPIHPLLIPNHTPEREASGTIVTGNSSDWPASNENHITLYSDLSSVQQSAELQSISGTSEFVSPTQRKSLWWSGASSIDFTDVSEQLVSASAGPSYLSEGIKCRLCERFLLQRSPWSSRRIVRTGDMPVTGVLSCCHVFHAECLEQTTPKTQKHDPPCPLCTRSEENVVEQPAVSKLRNGLLRLKSFAEDGPSRPWGCRQVNDCDEGALHSPIHNTMLLLNRSRLKKHLSLKGNSSKDHQDKLKKTGAYSLQLDSRSIKRHPVVENHYRPNNEEMIKL